MATIDTLRPSITSMSYQEKISLISKIRAIRRTRPEPRRSAPAKVLRAPSRKAPKQQDLFQLANGMTQSAKDTLILELLRGL
jgi:hypothetical protein